MRLGERAAQAGQRAGHEVVEARPHHLERRQRRAEPRAHRLQHRQRAVEIWATAERGADACRPRLQAKHGAGDHPQCALRADEQLLQIIPGVVLQQLVQRPDDRPIRQHDLEPQDVLPRHAVADHRVAAGIGGNIAADRARAARTQVDREQQVGRLRCLLDGGKRRAGQHGHGGHHRVELLDAAHALQRQQYAARNRLRPAGQAGQPALRHHGDAGLRTQAQGGCDLLRGARPHPGERLDGRESAPILQHAGRDVVPGRHDIRAEFLLQSCGDILHKQTSLIVLPGLDPGIHGVPQTPA